MTDQSTDYDFDVALSFAGEDRDFVKELAERLSERGIKHFYDEDHLAEMWGENLYEFLDEVYRKRARYAVLFVSRHYAEKAWPRRERQSAQARSVEEKMAYVLPVRLDDSELPGLLPSVMYLDSRRLGIAGIVDILVQKLAGTRPGLAEAAVEWDGKVPRTQHQIDLLLEQRPPAWEWLLFAAYLLQGKEALEDSYRDHGVGYGQRTGIHVTADEAFPFLSQAFAEARAITARLEPLLSPEMQESAFGAPGEPGDEAQIKHMARRLCGLHEECLDWAARIRGTTASEDFRPALELLGHYMDQPVESFRDFVDLYAEKVDQIPAWLALDEAERGELRISIDLVFDVPGELSEAFSREMDRLKSRY